jgi:hypothetical protein
MLPVRASIGRGAREPRYWHRAVPLELIEREAEYFESVPEAEAPPKVDFSEPAKEAKS